MKMNRKRRKRIIKKRNKVLSSSYLDFPFLTDSSTKSYLKKNKIVFILRGLPGSGKSYLAKKILDCYTSSFVCSADLYFINIYGSYDYNADKLKDAHEYCKNSFSKAIIVGKKHIIVDNTNIQRWEIEFYIKTANDNNYLVLIVEPKTPWKLDIEKLEKNNQHGCLVDYIESRKCLFKVIIPYFWGFFVNEYMSFYLTKLAEKYFKDCCNLFQAYESDVKDYKSLVYESLFNVDYKKILHCTTYFEGNHKDESEMDLSYCSNPDVIKSTGKHFKLFVKGFIFTPRTTGAMVKLSKQNFKIWKSEDAFLYKLNNKGKLVPSAYNDDGFDEVLTKETSFPLPSLNNYSEGSNNKFSDTSLSDSMDKVSSNVKIQMKKGSRAHFTIGCAYGIEAVQTGFDVMSIKHKHNNYLNILYQNDCSYIYYGDGECEVLLDWPMPVDCLFAGYFL